MKSLELFLHENAQEGFVSIATLREAMERFTCKARTVEEAIFKAGLTPLRYRRNQQSLTQADQHRLFDAHVLVVGCGGLGGLTSELLARVGIGSLTLIDPDVYEEHNLNRQIFSTVKTLGQSKAKTVRKRLLEINPALHVRALQDALVPENAHLLVKGKSVVVDALDCPLTKTLLAFTCNEENVAFVHGAIGGWMGQCSTSKNLEEIYKDGEKGAEKQSGNLPMTAAFCACLQASLVLKTLLDKPVLEDSLLFFDLYDMEMMQARLF
ncbi:MAG: ThiF family adenylyltransferase [Campylobacterales bacterium]|nr:ThiF family adenylyltransferase [Campylobacterales bacterium]